MISISSSDFITTILVVSTASCTLALNAIAPQRAYASSAQNSTLGTTAILPQEPNLRLLSPEKAVTKVLITQQITPLIPLESIPEFVERGYFTYSESSFKEWDIPAQLNTIFGWRSFPEGSFAENEVIRDAEILHIIVQDALNNQAQNDVTIRTRDLENPFSTSLGENPNYLGNTQPVESDGIVTERLLRQ
jgi:hypothetical protein